MSVLLGNLKHVFVLMMENRSFDHMLGFSALTGTSAQTGQPTRVLGLDGTESNDFGGRPYAVSRGADYVLRVDPHHEFPDILCQLCGPKAKYQWGGAYPPADRSGFVTSYAASGGSQNPGEIMKCFTPDQLPVLYTLASEFAVCDNWYASMPGPTWPNRMFLHAGSSGGLDHSPTTAEMLGWEIGPGYSFLNKTIFDLLKENGITRRIYGGDHFPMVAALKGIDLGDIREYENFAPDLKQANYPFFYVFIEPSYDVLNNYEDGSSQHPLGDVRRGEMLIKTTYEAIRNSPHWESSMLIITWDENGGFYDHCDPPTAMAPGDSWEGSEYNQNGFTFKKYGPRVPAVVVSPLIPKGLIDHRIYDHTSVLATIEKQFELVGMTNRDRSANSLLPLLQNAGPRPAPTQLPELKDYGSAALGIQKPPGAPAPPGLDRASTVDNGNVPAIVHSAMQQDLRLSPEKRHEIIERVQLIRTVGDARDYVAEVQGKLNAVK